jgi:hypothetical protein
MFENESKQTRACVLREETEKRTLVFLARRHRFAHCPEKKKKERKVLKSWLEEIFDDSDDHKNMDIALFAR